MTNWEFFDNQTPESTIAARRRRCAPARTSRPPAARNRVCTFKQVSRVLAGFHDGLADEGVGAGPGSLVGLRIAQRAGLDRPRGRLRGSGSGGRAPRTPAAPRSRPTTTRPRPTRPPRRHRARPPPNRASPTRRRHQGAAPARSPATPSPEDTSTRCRRGGRARRGRRRRTSRRRAPRCPPTHHEEEEGLLMATTLTPDPQRLLGRPEVVDPRHLQAPRRLPGARQGARHGAGRHHPGRQGLLAARPRRRRLPDRHEVVVHGAPGRRPPLPRRQRRRVRAGHLQGRPADDGQPARAHRGRRDQLVRHRLRARVHLPAR